MKEEGATCAGCKERTITRNACMHECMHAYMHACLRASVCALLHRLRRSCMRAPSTSVRANRKYCNAVHAFRSFACVC
eukprot:331392-Chlamydomonas_euryale.AAC.2